MLAEAIDRVKTSKEDRALVAVGGGSILVPDHIPGISEVIRPEHFDAANAVGAAIASVSGQVDRIFHLGPDGRQAVLDEARDEAREQAVAAGADPGTVQIIEVEEIPLAYLTSPAVRVRVQAAGTLGGQAEPPPQGWPASRIIQTAQSHKHIGGIMKRHRGRLTAVAAAAIPVLALTACTGSTSPASTQQPVNKVF